MRGKNISAIFSAVRAKSKALFVVFAQFMKGNTKEGESEPFKDISIETKHLSKIASLDFYILMRTLVKPLVVIPACPESFLQITFATLDLRRIPDKPE